MACQKSDCPIVVRKPVKAGGAKGQQAIVPGVEAESAREAVRRWNRKRRE